MNFQALKPTARDRLFSQMRELRALATQLEEKNRPRNTHIDVGSECVRQSAKAEAIFTLLRSLNSQSIEDSLETAKGEARLWAQTWNKKREWQVQIYECFLDDELERIAERLKRAVEEVSV